MEGLIVEGEEPPLYLPPLWVTNIQEPSLDKNYILINAQHEY